MERYNYNFHSDPSIDWDAIDLWEYDTDRDLVFDGNPSDRVSLPNELIKGVLPRGSTLLFSESNVGKSFLALSWGLHVAAGLPWHGHKISYPGTVVHVYSEGRAAFSNRKAVAKRYMGITEPLPFIGLVSKTLLGGPPDEKTRDEVSLSAAEHGWAIAAAVKDKEWPAVSLVVVDTLFQTNRGNENSAEDMAVYFQDIHRFLSALGDPSLLLVHHTGLAGGSERPRGSTSLQAACDASYSLEGKGEAPKTIVLTCRKQRDIVQLPPTELLLDKHVVYQEDGEVLLDEDGMPITSCVITVAPDKKEDHDRAVKARQDRMEATKARILDEVTALLEANPEFKQRDILDAVKGNSNLIRRAYTTVKHNLSLDSVPKID